MAYLNSVQRGIDFIEDHLDEDLDLRSVSRAAGVSHWHYQRTFKALTGDTLMAYVRARRLAIAAERLRNTDERILDIALRARFESQEAFTRAFKRTFGLTPGAFRKQGNRHLFLTKAQVERDYLRHLQRGISLEPELVEAPARRLLGLRTTFFSVDSEKNNIGEELPALWDAFIPQITGIGSRVDGMAYGVVSAEEDSERLTYVAGVESAGEARGDLIVEEVPAATYAVFTHRGRAADVNHTVSYIYATWLAQSGHQHTYGPDLELYGDEWHPTSAESVMHYAIPIQR